MKIPMCLREPEVTGALKNGRWTSELRAHLAACETCKETVQIAGSLQDLAATPAEYTAPVPYRIVWLRAQLTRKEAYLSRLERITLLSGWLVFVLALVGAMVWKWDLVRSWIAFSPAAPGGHLSLYILAGCAAFLWVLTEELFRRDT